MNLEKLVSQKVAQEINLPQWERKSHRALAWAIIRENGLPDNKHRTLRRLISSEYNKLGEAGRVGYKTVGDDITRIETDKSLNIEYKGKKSITSLPEAIEFFEIDTDVWECTKLETRNYDVTTGEGVTYTNYYLKTSWIPKKPSFDTEQFVEDIRTAFREFTVPVFTIGKPSASGKMLEIDIFDAHLGKLAWHRETGENYDIRIARERYIDAFSDLLQEGYNRKVEQIIYPIGNDLFQSDSLNHTTTKGTPVDHDIRWPKMWLILKETILKTIYMGLQVAPMKIVCVPGNHDEQVMFYFSDMLHEHFNGKGLPIEIENEPTTRKYIKYGKNGIMYTHGDRGKYDKYPLTMLQEIRKLEGWESVENLEVHCGHIHTQKGFIFKPYEEISGVIVRFLASISGTDAWHAKNHFVGNVKAAESFLWDTECGMLANYKSPVMK